MPKLEPILAPHMGLGGGKVTAKLSDIEPTDASELLEDWHQCHTT